MSGTVHSKAVEMWWKICLALVGHHRLQLKLPLRGTRFQSIEDIQENSRRELKSIPENTFEKCFDDWIIRWHKCIISGGTYFEGDKINVDE